MSSQTNRPSELSWDKRPLTVRDMALMIAVIVFACMGSAALIAFSLRNQAGATAALPADSPPAGQAVSQQSVSSEQSTSTGAAGPGQAIFEAKCATCHSIGGGIIVGPDLEGVTERRDSAWLARWIAEPDTMLAEGDPTATELFQEFNNIPMANMGLSAAEVADVIAYLANPGGGTAAPAAVTLPEGDADRGKAIFTGAIRLQNGGPACISCHTTTGIGPLGGGTLGPDLTNVHARYGETGLPTTLQNLPFPTMQGIFGPNPLTDNEAADLYAYFVQTNDATAQTINYTFVLIGLAGCGLLILCSRLIWRKRLTAVRKPLLGGAK